MRVKQLIDTNDYIFLIDVHHTISSKTWQKIHFLESGKWLWFPFWNCHRPPKHVNFKRKSLWPHNATFHKLLSFEWNSYIYFSRQDHPVKRKGCQTKTNSQSWKGKQILLMQTDPANRKFISSTCNITSNLLTTGWQILIYVKRQ